MTTGIEPISEALWQEKDWKAMITVLIIPASIANRLNEKHDTLQKLDEVIQETFKAFMLRLVQEEDKHE